MTSKKHKWVWCKMCCCASYICPECGNNCCNGGYGKVDGEICKVCLESYKYQQEAEDKGTAPSREECTGELPDMNDIFGEDEV